jgi:hypothetical protein
MCPESFLTHENRIWELKFLIVLRVQQYLISICSAAGHCCKETHCTKCGYICLLDLFTVPAAEKGNTAQVFDVLWFWSVLCILVDWFMGYVVSNNL